jgi:hypothetical protein
MPSAAPSLSEQLERCAALIVEDQSGDDPLGLTDDEASVLGIDRDRWPMMAAVWCLFSTVVDIDSLDVWGFSTDVIEAERLAWPDLPRRSHELHDFTKFSARWLSSVEAAQTSSKTFFWYVRAGLITTKGTAS